MSDPAIPDRIGPAMRWVLAGIALFVFFLGASDSFRDGKNQTGFIYIALFLATFVIAVKWDQIAEFITNRRPSVAFVFLAVGAVFLFVGIYLLATTPVSQEFGVAKQEIDAAKREIASLRHENEQLKQHKASSPSPSLNAPVSAPKTHARVIPLPHPAEVPTAFSGFSNADLKLKVSQITVDLRAFEASYRKQFKAIKLAPKKGATPEEQRNEFAINTKQISDLKEQETQNYQKIFGKEVRSIYNELLDRLSKIPPPPVSPLPTPSHNSNYASPVITAVLSGSIANENTLSDLSKYFDELAALIP